MCKMKIRDLCVICVLRATASGLFQRVSWVRTVFILESYTDRKNGWRMARPYIRPAQLQCLLPRSGHGTLGTPASLFGYEGACH